MSEVTSTAARAQLLALAELLRIGEQYQRLDSDGLAFIAGTRGIVRPGPGGELLVVLRKDAPAVVERLLGTGLIAVSDTGTMLLARSPTPAEFGLLRELIGIKSGSA
jgi:hypothetical protein